MQDQDLDSRRRVAREAARLLYSGAFREYKQAKEEAARSLSSDSMPSNFEVALELDLLADEAEGADRKRIIQEKRCDAITVMKVLSHFNPRLIGSVWRGTARKDSDIDIAVYSADPDAVTETLKASGFAITGVEESTVSERGRQRRSRHISLRLVDGNEVEVVVRPLEERDEHERCDIYGDLKRGATLPELERLMKADPLRKFVPERRWR